jgi:TRAP-type C4-dicarboxylate transport system permease small subunit
MIDRIARTMAVIGGVVLCAMIGMVCLSVLGRGINTLAYSPLLQRVAPGLAGHIAATGIGPIRGDYELVQAGAAFAVFAFLPLCQLSRGHATVEVFTLVLGPRINRAIDGLWDAVLTLATLLVTWRLWAGMTSQMDSGQTTFILQFPLWWAYAASLLAAVIASVVAIWATVERIGGAR